MEGLYSDEDDDVRQTQNLGGPDLHSPNSCCTAVAASAAAALSPQAALAALPDSAARWTIADVAGLSELPQASSSRLHTTLMQWARACGHVEPAHQIRVADLLPHVDKLPSVLQHCTQAHTKPVTVTPCKPLLPSLAQLCNFFALYEQRLGVSGSTQSTLALIKQPRRVCNGAGSHSSSRRQRKAKRTTRGSTSTSNASPAGNDQQAGPLQPQPLPLVLQHPQQTQLQPMSLQRWYLEQAQQQQQQQAVWVLPRQQQHAGGAPPKAQKADTSLAALLLQCPPTNTSSSSSDDEAYNMHLLQLQEYATSHFGGLSQQEIPAALVVINHMCSVQERANMCLVAAASGGDGDGAAQASAGAACMAARQKVQALLRLAAQPVMVWLAKEWGWQQDLGLLRTAADVLDAFCRSLTTSGSTAP